MFLIVALTLCCSFASPGKLSSFYSFIGLSSVYSKSLMVYLGLIFFERDDGLFYFTLNDVCRFLFRKKSYFGVRLLISLCISAMLS